MIFISLDKVIELGQIGEPAVFNLDRDMFFIPCIVVFIVIVGFITTLVMNDINFKRVFFASVVVISFCISIFWLYFVLPINTDIEKNDKIAKWKEKTVETYIEEMDSTTAELINFTELKSNKDIKSDYFNYYLTKEQLKKEPFFGEVKYKIGDKEFEEDGWFVLELSDSAAEAVMDYKLLDQELGHDVELGNYNKKIVIPIANGNNLSGKLIFSK